MFLITISVLKQAINKLAKFDSLNKMVKKTKYEHETKLLNKFWSLYLYLFHLKLTINKLPSKKSDNHICSTKGLLTIS